MKYDFESIMDRSGKDSIAVDLQDIYGEMPPMNVKEGFDVIPMWIADMNFPTVPTIPEAIRQRAAHPAYGYFAIRDEYYDAIINWQKVRNGVEDLPRRAIGYENGVLGGMNSALHALCSQGDSILVHSPTYVGFTEVFEFNGYNVVHSDLVKDEDGIWRMDYEDMESKIRENRIHVAVFCSPHNPTGRVWEEEEIRQAMEVFQRNQVYVISDEIWSDLTLYGNKHIPTQSLSEDAKMRTVALYAPSKTFNLAGLIGSYHIIYNKWLRDRVRKESTLTFYNSINLLSMYGLMGAYSPEGMEWVDELREVLGQNVQFACDFISENFPGVTVSQPQGTYMLFLDMTEYCATSGRDLSEIIDAGISVGVIWQDGRNFYHPCAIRMNLALPHSRVQEAFRRLKQYVFTESSESAE